jgi:hypothetical protein
MDDVTTRVSEANIQAIGQSPTYPSRFSMRLLGTSRRPSGRERGREEGKKEGDNIKALTQTSDESRKDSKDSQRTKKTVTTVLYSCPVSLRSVLRPAMLAFLSGERGRAQARGKPICEKRNRACRRLPPRFERAYETRLTRLRSCQRNERALG